MKHMLVFLCLLLSACNLSGVSPQPVATGPTAYIDPSYPTMESAPVTLMQTSSGIEVRADRAWRDGKQVNVEVCFTLLDASDWSIWSASLQYPDASILDLVRRCLACRCQWRGNPALRHLSFLNVHRMLTFPT
jgi:hypothetical protein